MVKRRCGIKTCAYNKAQEVDATLFSLNAKRLQQWSFFLIAAGVIAKNKDFFVCEHHFKEEDIISVREIKDSKGNVIQKVSILKRK